MKPLLPAVLLTLACLASSCSKHPTRTPATGPAAGETPAASYCLPASTAWADDEYTQWMTRAELQYFQDQAPTGQYFAHVEGRNNAGLCEFRAVRKPLVAEQYAAAEVCWGLSDNEVFDTELRLLRAGFVRKSMQVFVSASGVALHQLVWLKPVGAPPAPAPQTAASSPPEPPPPPSVDETAGLDHPATPPAAEPEATPAADTSPPEVKPPAARVAPPTESRSGAERAVAGPKKFTTYTVVQGDVVEKIARRQHTTVEAILAANNLKNDSLQIGQKLKIPKK